jgi:hypothetical protein
MSFHSQNRPNDHVVRRGIPRPYTTSGGGVVRGLLRRTTYHVPPTLAKTAEPEETVPRRQRELAEQLAASIPGVTTAAMLNRGAMP